MKETKYKLINKRKNCVSFKFVITLFNFLNGIIHLHIINYIIIVQKGRKIIGKDSFNKIKVKIYCNTLS